MADTSTTVGHPLLSLPSAARTWEMQAVLRGTATETEQQPLMFSHPVRIVGCYASLIVVPAAALVLPMRAPTLDDIEVILRTDASDRNLYTKKIGALANAAAGTVPNGAKDAVTLSSLNHGLRYLQLELGDSEQKTAQLEITFRWKHPDAVTQGRYPDTLVSLAFFADYVDPRRPGI